MCNGERRNRSRGSGAVVSKVGTLHVADQSVRRRTRRVLDSRFVSSDCLAAWRIFSFVISPLRGSRSDETRLTLLGYYSHPPRLSLARCLSCIIFSSRASISPLS